MLWYLRKHFQVFFGISGSIRKAFSTATPKTLSKTFPAAYQEISQGTSRRIIQIIPRGYSSWLFTYSLFWFLKKMFRKHF